MDKHLNLSLKITAALVVVLAILNIVGTNLLATQGQELEQIHQKTLQLENENQILANKIAHFSSLSYLEEQAQEKGFIKISKPLALKDIAPVAYINNR